MTWLPAADAAFAQNIPPGFDIAAGYYGGPNAYHVWTEADWGRFPGFRFPFWVAGDGGQAEGADAIAALRALGVPAGCITGLDMEDRRDITYVTRFGGQLQAAGFKVWVYGSADSVYGNPPLNGYFVAHYGLSAPELEALMRQPHVRAAQYASYPAYDVSVVKAWTEGEMWHG